MAQTNQKKQTRPKRPWVSWILPAVTLVATLGLCGYVATTGLAPVLYLVMAMVVSLLLFGAVFGLMRHNSKIGQGAGIALTILVVIACALAGAYLWRTVHTVKTISGTSSEQTRITTYVLQDSTVQSVEDLAGKNLGILSALDRTNTDTALEQMESEYGITLSTKEYDSLTELADGLNQNEVDAILLNEAYLDLYDETSGYETFPESLRAVLTLQIEHEVGAEQEQSSQLSDPIINILISGSDTRSNVIDQRGRSDVNIIASVNTQTHQILLISTPRDYFVPLDVGVEDAYDKLTHAGIYGMDVLMRTLENLYGIDLDYYFRLNFVGFEQVIDALGGVDVYSAYEFDSGDYHYQQGTNTLNGAQALAFVRNRYAFADGDRQRGKNQMAVVEGVLKKATSPSVLSNYLSILDSIQSCVDTNVPYDVISALVRQQLKGGATWSVESFSVNGSDSHSTTYSMNQDLYVMIPDEATVQEAKEKLAALGNAVDGSTEAGEEADSAA